MDFYQNYKQNLDGIDLCIKTELIFPALALIYSSIDIMAWMAYGDIGVKKRFTDWIDRWMYRNRGLEASSTDLYAARCSVLHTLTPDSDLSKKGNANIVAYAWGTADLNHYKEVAKERGITDQSFIHVNDLFDIYKEGVNEFLSDVESDSELQKSFNERIEKSYENISNDEMQYYKQLIDASKSN